MWPQTILPTSYSHEGWEWEPFRLPVLGVTMNPGLKILTCRFRNHTLSFHLRGTDSHRLKTDWVPDQDPYFIYLVSERQGIHCPEPASLLWEGPLRSKAVCGGQNWARGVGSSTQETVSALSPELCESPPLCLHIHPALLSLSHAPFRCQSDHFKTQIWSWQNTHPSPPPPPAPSVTAAIPLWLPSAQRGWAKLQRTGLAMGWPPQPHPITPKS